MKKGTVRLLQWDSHEKQRAPPPEEGGRQNRNGVMKTEKVYIRIERVCFEVTASSSSTLSTTQRQLVTL